MIKDRIKVLHVIPNLHIGGITRFLLDLTFYQRNSNIVDIAIFVLSSDNNKWEESFLKLNIKIYYGDVSPSSLNIKCIKKFSEIKSQYDIIHWHGFFPALSISTLTDNLIHVITHHSVLGSGRVRRLSYNLKWWLFKVLINSKFDCEVYNSLYTKLFWQKRKLHAKSNQLIYNGINFNEIKVYNTHILGKKEHFIIGTSSNFVRWKNIDILIEAFAEWCKGKNEIKLLIVGDGDEKENLKCLVSNLGISDIVVFTGHKSNVYDYQNYMDLCVFPSSGETFGLAALECMCLGKPVICMKSGGGICEVIGEGSKDIVNNKDEMIGRFNYYYDNSDNIIHTAKMLKKRSELFRMENKSDDYI